jgi:3-hydroxyisobutyrate dehydrogenase-like beta-hydroxyacid dehydrogenase
MSEQIKLGYVGLGNMGTPMAKRMVEWPGGLTIYDIRPEAMTPLAERGALLADTLADVAAADIISVKPGTVIAIHSTISDTTAVELASALKEQDIHVIDAPVSGGGRAARFGQLATMVGASDEIFARVEGPFSHWAELVVHAGPPGAGTRMKLARNMLTFTTWAAVGEAWKLADAVGLNLQDLGNVVRHTDKLTGGAGSIMYREDAKDLEPGHFLYDGFTHTRELGEKDLSLALALAESVSVDLPLAKLAIERLAGGLGVPHTGKEA